MPLINTQGQAQQGAKAAPAVGEEKSYFRKSSEERKAELKLALEYFGKAKNAVPHSQELLGVIAKWEKVVSGSRDVTSGPSTFKLLFGDNPQVGASVSLLTVLQKTSQGTGFMAGKIKKWAEKGVTVVFKPNKDSPADASYVIEKL